MWPKVNTVIDYWKELPKSKQPGSGKRGANDSLKLLLIHEVAEKFNNVLVAFQTDKPMTSFLAEREVLLRWFVVKLIRKRVLEQA